jgi:hypothetical protein
VVVDALLPKSRLCWQHAQSVCTEHAERVIMVSPSSLLEVAMGRYRIGSCEDGKLKMRAMSGIRVEDKPRVRELLLKDVRIHRRHHDVIMTVHHKSPVRDVL